MCESCIYCDSDSKDAYYKFVNFHVSFISHTFYFQIIHEVLNSQTSVLVVFMKILV